MQSFLQTIIGVFGAILVYVALKFFIELIVEYYKVVGRIAKDLIVYGKEYGNPGIGPPEDMDMASKSLREDAGLLSEKVAAIPWYPFWNLFGFVPTIEEINQAKAQLIGLSNSVRSGNPLENAERADKIVKLLSIKTPVE